jgi:hypothetical protein
MKRWLVICALAVGCSKTATRAPHWAIYAQEHCREGQNTLAILAENTKEHSPGESPMDKLSKPVWTWSAEEFFFCLQIHGGSDRQEAVVKEFGGLARDLIDQQRAASGGDPSARDAMAAGLARLAELFKQVNDLPLGN